MKPYTSEEVKLTIDLAKRSPSPTTRASYAVLATAMLAYNEAFK